jgi:hypothetical protein
MPTQCNPWLRKHLTNSTANYHQPPTEGRTLENMTKDPISEFFLYKKNPDICSGAAGYISWEETFSFFNQSSRPSNFLFQISKRLSECDFSLKDRTSLGGLLQNKTTSRLHVERTRNEGSLRIQPWNAHGLVDTGPAGFRNNTFAGHGPWPGPRVGTRRDVASTTPNPI